MALKDGIPDIIVIHMDSRAFGEVKGLCAKEKHRNGRK